MALLERPPHRSFSERNSAGIVRDYAVQYNYVSGCAARGDELLFCIDGQPSTLTMLLG
jgi:hypothetical protein